MRCADCGTPLTACYSRGTHKSYPYYLCPKRGCTSYGKSVRRDKLEGEFELLLQSVTPAAPVVRIAERMFGQLWEHRMTRMEASAKALGTQLVKIDTKIAGLLDRILEASVPSVIASYEKEVGRLEADKIVIKRTHGRCQASEVQL